MNMKSFFIFIKNKKMSSIQKKLNEIQKNNNDLYNKSNIIIKDDIIEKNDIIEEDVKKEKKKDISSGGVKYVNTEERCNKKIVYKNGRKKYVKENKEYISLSEYKKKKEKKEKK
jgi:hypothetical protein